jgi:glycosyl hydrolase family 113
MERWTPIKNLKNLTRLGKWAGVATILIISLGFLTGTFLDSFSSKDPANSSVNSSIPVPPPLRGMALGTFSQEQTYSYLPDLDELKALGINAILLMVPWYQKDIRENQMEPRWEWNKENITLPNEQLKGVVDKAHRLGMKVLLMPYLRFDHRETREWRGVLQPNNLSEWQNNYIHFILYYAELAETWGVEYLSVGSELGNMEKQDEFWQGLIQQVREKYRGKLLYSVNWDHYKVPTFWKYLDAIGVSSYNRLTDDDHPNLAELKKSWEKSKRKLLSFQKDFPDKKLIITEVGYPSLKGASRDPWNYFATTPTDPGEQALCYQAFIEAWNDTPELEGVFWWVWYGPGGPEDRSYTPRGKPAAQVLKRWYNGKSS